MIERLPQKKDKRWILMLLITSIMFSLLMIFAVLVAGWIQGENQFKEAMVVVFVFVIGCNLVNTIIGFLGGRYMYLLTSLAIVTGGVIAILYTCTDFAGWEFFGAVMVLILLVGFGGIIGIIVQIIYASRKKPFGKVGKILFVMYVIILLAGMLLTLFGLDYSDIDYENAGYSFEFENSIIGEFRSISYLERTAEYTQSLIISEDGKLQYKMIYVDEDLVETLKDSKEIQLSTQQMIDLVNYILYETEFIYLEEDISTEENILDGASAVIDIDFDSESFSSGGYYPFNNLNFKKVKSYIFDLKSDGNLPSYADILTLENPDEKAVSIIIGYVLEEMDDKIDDSVGMMGTYENYEYDEKENCYSFDLEIEVEYENSSKIVKGRMTYYVEENRIVFTNESLFKFGKVSRTIMDIETIR